YEPMKPTKCKQKKKKTTLKYYNDQNLGLQPEKAHSKDAEFDLKYPGKETLVLPPRTVMTIDLKIAVEVSQGSMMQLASRSSLAAKGIMVKGSVIDAGY
ncbi:5403_t:CDS:1, partial [Ambispora gerdemannii]